MRLSVSPGLVKVSVTISNSGYNVVGMAGETENNRYKALLEQEKAE